jgi:hypothetical protein
MSRNRTPAVTPDMMTGTVGADSFDADLGGLDRSITLEHDLSLEELRDNLNATVSMSSNDPAFKKFTADSAFMEEQVLVRVLPSADQNAEKIVDVYNDGRPQRFIRGEWTIARRKYVEVLARAKPFSVATPEITDGNGDRTTKIDINHGMRYPFEMRDKNPIGQAWLNDILSQP